MQSEIGAIVATDKQIYSISTAFLHYRESKSMGSKLIQDGNKNPSLFFVILMYTGFANGSGPWLIELTTI